MYFVYIPINLLYLWKSTDQTVKYFLAAAEESDVDTTFVITGAKELWEHYDIDYEVSDSLILSFHQLVEWRCPLSDRRDRVRVVHFLAVWPG